MDQNRSASSRLSEISCSLDCFNPSRIQFRSAPAQKFFPVEESLTRLQTDTIDLVQFHEVIDEGVPGMIFGQGVIEAALKAREQGKIRHIGFTGHRWPHLHLEMLGHDFPWDTVQFPANLLDAQYRSSGIRLKEKTDVFSIISPQSSAEKHRRNRPLDGTWSVGWTIGTFTC